MMMINSERLKAKLNDKSTIPWHERDKSTNSYKLGYLNCLEKVLAIVGEIEGKNLEDLKATMIKEAEAKKVGILSHSEKNIVEGCISLMEDLHSAMLEYMNMMGFEYNHESSEEFPQFSFSYFEIVQKLLLQKTSHSGEASTRQKCQQLGFDSADTIVIGEKS